MKYLQEEFKDFYRMLIKEDFLTKIGVIFGLLTIFTIFQNIFSFIINPQFVTIANIFLGFFISSITSYYIFSKFFLLKINKNKFVRRYSYFYIILFILVFSGII